MLSLRGTGTEELGLVGHHQASNLRSASANMASTQLHPEVMTDYLQIELTLGRMLGPFLLSFSAPELHINRFWVIPKAQTGKRQLITDLSFPPGMSVDDGISPELSSLSYTSVDHVADTGVSLGMGTQLVKVDIESAYHLILVHPHNRPLQAVQWQNRIFVDPMLPFGLRSAPKIFSYAVADVLHWYLNHCGIAHLYYY